MKLLTESAELAKTTDPLRMEILAISTQINEINDKIVGKFLTKRDEAQRKKNDLEKIINKEKAAIARNKHEISKVNQRITDLTNDLNEAKGQLSTFGVQLEESEQKIEVFRKLYCTGYYYLQTFMHFRS